MNKGDQIWTSFRAPRLEMFSYRGRHAYSVTICAAKKQARFVEPGILSRLRGILEAEVTEFGFHLWAHCFMPDHLHLLLQGRHESSDLRGMIKSFKQKSAYGYIRDKGEKLWQRSYWDHVVREDEGLIRTAIYIMENPARAGLVSHWREYKYSVCPALRKAWG